MNIRELVRAMERRPGMYIEPESLESLSSFIRGFLFAKSAHGVLDEHDADFSEQFYPWLKDKYAMENAHSWSVLIEQIAATHGRNAVQLFFAEFSSFFSASRLNCELP